MDLSLSAVGLSWVKMHRDRGQAANNDDNDRQLMPVDMEPDVRHEYR